MRNTSQFPTSTTKLVAKHPVNSPRPPLNWLRTLRHFPTSTTKLVVKHSAKHQRTPTKLVANTPSGVGADSSCPYPNIANCTYSYHQIRVYSLSNMHIHIIKYVFSSHHVHIFALPYQYIRFLLSIILNIKHPIQHIYTRKLHKLFLRLFSHKNTESSLTLHLIYMYAP